MLNTFNCAEQVQIQKYIIHAYKTPKTVCVQTVKNKTTTTKTPTTTKQTKHQKTNKKRKKKKNQTSKRKRRNRQASKQTKAKSTLTQNKNSNKENKNKQNPPRLNLTRHRRYGIQSLSFKRTKAFLLLTVKNVAQRRYPGEGCWDGRGTGVGGGGGGITDGSHAPKRNFKKRSLPQLTLTCSRSDSDLFPSHPLSRPLTPLKPSTPNMPPPKPLV